MMIFLLFLLLVFYHLFLEKLSAAKSHLLMWCITNKSVVLGIDLLGHWLIGHFSDIFYPVIQSVDLCSPVLLT